VSSSEGCSLHTSIGSFLSLSLLVRMIRLLPLGIAVAMSRPRKFPRAFFACRLLRSSGPASLLFIFNLLSFTEVHYASSSPSARSTGDPAHMVSLLGFAVPADARRRSLSLRCRASFMIPRQPSLFSPSPIDHQKPGDTRRCWSMPAAHDARAAPAYGSSSPFPSATSAEVERTRALTAALFAQLDAEGRNPYSPANVAAFRDELLDQLERADPGRDYAQLLLPGGSLK
jgi:hypothetical protein